MEICKVPTLWLKVLKKHTHRDGKRYKKKKVYIYIDLRETFWMDIIRNIRTAHTNQSPSMASTYAVIDSQAN